MPSRECIVAPSRANNLQSNLQSNPPRGRSWHRAASSHHSELLARLRTRPGTFSHIIVPARAVCSSPRRVLSSLSSGPLPPTLDCKLTIRSYQSSYLKGKVIFGVALEAVNRSALIK